MLGQSLFSCLAATSPHQTNPSPAPTRSPAARLDHALRRAPFDKRAELEELCHWLVCCKNLWPDAASGMHADRSAPFSVYERHQSLVPDPDCINRTICKVLDDTDTDTDADAELIQDIGRYVHASDAGDWQALREQRHPACGIDPSDAPFNWPKQCLTWAVRTMKMEGADLSHADLSDTDLSGIDFYRAILFGCNLKNVVACDTDLSYADLSYANMEGAELAGSDVNNTFFRNANLAGARLTGLTFSTRNDNLKDAILTGACLEDIGLDIGPYDVAADGAYALRKGFLPPTLDHLIRDHLDVSHEREDSDSDGSYMAEFSASEAGESSDSEAG